MQSPIRTSIDQRVRGLVVGRTFRFVYPPRGGGVHSQVTVVAAHHHHVLPFLSEQRRHQQAVPVESLVRPACRSPPLSGFEQRHRRLQFVRDTAAKSRGRRFHCTACVHSFRCHGAADSKHCSIVVILQAYLYVRSLFETMINRDISSLLCSPQRDPPSFSCLVAFARRVPKSDRNARRSN